MHLDYTVGLCSYLCNAVCNLFQISSESPVVSSNVKPFSGHIITTEGLFLVPWLP